jgi:Mn-dependent DtxR family transcriptional regulator
VRQHFDPHAGLAALSAEWGVPEDVARAALASLDERGLVVHDEDGGITPTDDGEQMVERLVAERRASLSRLLEGWAPEQQPELVGFLTRLAHELSREPDAELTPSGA